MSLELARSLLLSEALDRAALARALRACAHGSVGLVRALVEAGVDPARVEAATAAWEGPSVVRVRASAELAHPLPPGLLSRWCAAPLRLDPQTNTVDVAMVDPTDALAQRELAHHLGRPVRPVRAPYPELIAALDQLAGRGRGVTATTLDGLGPAPAPTRPSRTPAWGMPAADSDEDPASQRYEPIPLTVRRSIPAGVLGKGDQVVYSVEHREHPSEPPIPLVGIRSTPPRGEAPLPPFASPEPTLAAMRAAKGRDDVMAALLLGARAVALRVGLLVVKREAFVGWSCSEELCKEEAWRAVQVSTGYPSALATAAAEGTYLGSVQPSEAHRTLLAAVRRASRDVAITPVKVGGRPTLLVYADDLGDPALSTRRMEELARAAGEALARVLREKR